VTFVASVNVPRAKLAGMITPTLFPRRAFLRTLAAGSSTLAAAGFLEGCATVAAQGASTTPAPGPSSTGAWDMSWLGLLKAQHRVVFNVTQIAGGNALYQGNSWMDGYAQAHGLRDADLNLVLVFRHDAVRMVLNDTMWARTGPDAAKSDTSAPVPPPTRNQFLGDISAALAGKGPPAVAPNTIAQLMSRGAIIIACNMALNGQAFTLRRKETLSESDAQAQIRAAVSPGVFVMPNGVFSIGRAQDAGCGYFQPG
jgi:hypothetical protein